ncbi:MAG TPA: PH domain-containing protein [Acidimicrobiales bacterium]
MPTQLRRMVVGEEILVDIKPHWMYLIGPLLTAMAVVGLAVGLEVGFPHTSVGWHRVETVVAIIPCLWLVLRFIRWRMTSLVLTSFRLVERHGVASTRTTEIWLSNVAEVEATQSLFRRMLGTGELEVTLYGDDDIRIFRDVRKPVILRRVIARRLTPRPNPPGFL